MEEGCLPSVVVVHSPPVSSNCRRHRFSSSDCSASSTPGSLPPSRKTSAVQYSPFVRICLAQDVAAAREEARWWEKKEKAQRKSFWDDSKGSVVQISCKSSTPFASGSKIFSVPPRFENATSHWQSISSLSAGTTTAATSSYCASSIPSSLFQSSSSPDVCSKTFVETSSPPFTQSTFRSAPGGLHPIWACKFYGYTKELYKINLHEFTSNNLKNCLIKLFVAYVNKSIAVIRFEAAAIKYVALPLAAFKLAALADVLQAACDYFLEGPAVPEEAFGNAHVSTARKLSVDDNFCDNKFFGVSTDVIPPFYDDVGSNYRNFVEEAYVVLTQCESIDKLFEDPFKTTENTQFKFPSMGLDHAPHSLTIPSPNLVSSAINKETFVFSTSQALPSTSEETLFVNEHPSREVSASTYWQQVLSLLMVFLNFISSPKAIPYIIYTSTASGVKNIFLSSHNTPATPSEPSASPTSEASSSDAWTFLSSLLHYSYLPSSLILPAEGIRKKKISSSVRARASSPSNNETVISSFTWPSWLNISWSLPRNSVEVPGGSAASFPRPSFSVWTGIYYALIFLLLCSAWFLPFLVIPTAFFLCFCWLFLRLLITELLFLYTHGSSLSVKCIRFFRRILMPYMPSTPTPPSNNATTPAPSSTLPHSGLPLHLQPHTTAHFSPLLNDPGLDSSDSEYFDPMTAVSMTQESSKFNASSLKENNAATTTAFLNVFLSRLIALFWHVPRWFGRFLRRFRTERDVSSFVSSSSSALASPPPSSVYGKSPPRVSFSPVVASQWFWEHPFKKTLTFTENEFSSSTVPSPPPALQPVDKISFKKNFFSCTTRAFSLSTFTQAAKRNTRPSYPSLSNQTARPVSQEILISGVTSTTIHPSEPLNLSMRRSRGLLNLQAIDISSRKRSISNGPF